MGTVSHFYRHCLSCRSLVCLIVKRCPCHIKSTLSYSSRDYDLEYVSVSLSSAAASTAGGGGGGGSAVTSPRESKTSTTSTSMSQQHHHQQPNHDSLFDDLIDDKGNAVALTRRTDHTVNGHHITKW
jgi:hypothetical protein